ncbi:protein TolR [Sulfuriferula plumbiphila]|uniref:Protein TolR n=1 Tax=Sulfuriferula plumbiphila TaxID=171865 RepID=A0A512LBP7_9PROT|nr:protein TolR [Sulfuriferula plumbiphila]BBP03347.1 protein TolR [Sulfuriferula plumbiphila]GEP31571.1 protein TolR [Sulfuriferula plumbiphila]
MSSRRPRKQMNQINVVPYIDVMLVLLIIFMITAPLINPGQVALPSVAKSQSVPVEPIEVTIRADGRLRLRDRATGSADNAVTRTELADIINEKQRANPDQPVVIAADKNVRYEEVMKVMSLMQQNHVRRLGLLAKPGAS